MRLSKNFAVITEFEVTLNPLLDDDLKSNQEDGRFAQKLTNVQFLLFKAM